MLVEPTLKHVHESMKKAVKLVAAQVSAIGLVITMVVAACATNRADQAASHNDTSVPRMANGSSAVVSRSISVTGPTKLKPGDPFGITLGPLTIWLDSTTFHEAAGYLRAREFRFEVASTIVEQAACVHTSGPQAQYIVIYTHPADTGRTLNVELDPDPPIEDSVRVHCSESPLEGTKVGTTIPGIRVGARREVIELSTGAPTVRPAQNAEPTDTTVRYVLATDVANDQRLMDAPGDRRVILIVTYRNGVARRISVDRNNEYRDGPTG